MCTYLPIADINLEFDKLFEHNSDEISELMGDLMIYDNELNTHIFKKFIIQFAIDFDCILNKLKLFSIVKNLLTLKHRPTQVDFGSLFLTSSDYENILSVCDIDKLEFLINKYKNFICSKNILPIDPAMNFNLSADPYNISDKLLGKFLTTLNNYPIDLSYDKLDLIVKNMTPNTIKIIKYCIDYTDDFDSLKKINIYENITTKISINIIEFFGMIKECYIDRKTIFRLLIFKLMLIHNRIIDYDLVLDRLYCCSNLELLNMINILKPEIININLSQLKKIIFYGRLKVFEFLMDHIPSKTLLLLSESNPLDLTETKFSYNIDIWAGKSWNTDELEKDIIEFDDIKHVQLIQLIKLIAGEKNYVHIIWTNDIIKYWYELIIKFKSYINSQAPAYFIDRIDFLKLIGHDFNFDNKKSILKHIELFGRKNTWDIMVNEYKQSDIILDILLN